MKTSAGNRFDLDKDESRLVRLFRCMTDPERSDCLIHVIETLSNRLSLDPHCALPGVPPLRDELELELAERVMMAWPAEWPDQQLLDLDDAGDPGAFIRQNMEGEVLGRVLGTTFCDEDTADSLLDDFLNCPVAQNAIETLFYEFAQHTDGGRDAVIEILRADFLAFLREWREQIVATIESQSCEE